MSSSAELPNWDEEKPDEFGMVPPKEEEQQPEEKQKPIDLSDTLYDNGAIEDLMKDFLSKKKEHIKIPPPIHREIDETEYPYYRHDEPLYRIQEDHRIHEYVMPQLGSAGLFYANQIPPETKKPVEKPDPYPSRAGWRADYLPPHDPFAKEPKDKPKGKIGDYEMVESITTFDDIGGNAQAKALLTEITDQFTNPEQYAKWDVPVPKGILLHGEPGTGKTMLAKAFANQANAAFIEVPVATLRNPYHGVSEKNLKELFDKAAAHKKQVVIFFDEIDSLLTDRSTMMSSSPDSQLVNTFLQAMDGMSSASNIMVLGATNYPDRLDAAAVRPGRFDQKVEVKLPDAEGCRDIAARRLLAAERSAGRVFVEDDLDLEQFSRSLEGLSGADIAEIINRAKRTLAQTERTLRKTKIEDSDKNSEKLLFNDDDFGQLKISTVDLISTAIGYRLNN